MPRILLYFLVPGNGPEWMPKECWLQGCGSSWAGSMGVLGGRADNGLETSLPSPALWLGRAWVTRERAHLDAHVGVVGVYPCPQVFASSLGPQEVVQELGAVLEVVAAHAPLPGLPALQAWRVITGATLHAPGAAGPGQSVREGGRGHRVQESRLLETWAGPRGDREGGGEWAQGLSAAL